MRVRATAEIEAEKTRAIADLRAEVATLALDAAGRVVGETMSSDRQRRLVEEFLAESAAGGPRRPAADPQPEGPPPDGRIDQRRPPVCRSRLELARRDGTLDAWLGELRLAVELVGAEEAATVVDNPAIAWDQRRAIITGLLGSRVGDADPEPRPAPGQARPPRDPAPRRRRVQATRRPRSTASSSRTSPAPSPSTRRAGGDRRARRGHGRRARRGPGGGRPRADRGPDRPRRRPTHRCQRAGTACAAPRQPRGWSSLTPAPERSTEWPSDPTRSSASSRPTSTTSMRPRRRATSGRSSRSATASPRSTASRARSRPSSSSSPAASWAWP